MNKRSLLKGAIGAAVAGPDAMRRVMAEDRTTSQTHYYPPKSPYSSGGRDTVNTVQEAFDAVAHEARKVFLKQITDNRELLQKQLNNQMYAIQRQKSTSEAYKSYMITKLEEERANVWQRAEKLMSAAWGHDANGPQKSPY